MSHVSTDLHQRELVDSRVVRYSLFDDVNRAYREWQLDQFRPYLGQRILEIGCGVGGIIDLLGPRELIVGVDVDPACLAAATARFQNRPDCRFVLQDLFAGDDSGLAGFETLAFDSVVCMNVLEHVADDLNALQRLERLVTPSGYLALLVPAHPALYGRYDLLDGHQRRYTKRTVRELVGHTGFCIRSLYYFNAIGAIGWWIQYGLLGREIHGPAHYRMMNALLPVVRNAERCVRPPFGLSVIAVLQRPG